MRKPCTLAPQKLHQVVVLRAHLAGKGRFLRPSLVGVPPPQAAACVRLPAERGQEHPELETLLEADRQPVEGDTSPEVDTSLDALLASTSSADVQAQTSALEALASKYATEARARQTVLAAMGDPDPYVRSVIVGTLSSNRVPVIPKSGSHRRRVSRVP